MGRAVIDASGLPREIAQSTMLLWDGKTAKIQSDAVLGVLAGLGWQWRVAATALAVPRPWRNAIYRWRASRRDRITAEDPACGVPPAELVERWRSRLATIDDV